MGAFACTNHCAACGAHFHSTAAFDMHRRDGECIEPLDDPRFAALTETGKCELDSRVPYTPLDSGNAQVYPAGWRHGDPPMLRVAEPVTIWTDAKALERARQRFGGFAGAAPTA